MSSSNYTAEKKRSLSCFYIFILKICMCFWICVCVCTVESRFNEWPPSAPFHSLNRDFKLNRDFLMRNFILVTRFRTLNWDFTLIEIRKVETLLYFTSLEIKTLENINSLRLFLVFLRERDFSFSDSSHASFAVCCRLDNIWRKRKLNFQTLLIICTVDFAKKTTAGKPKLVFITNVGLFISKIIYYSNLGPKTLVFFFFLSKPHPPPLSLACSRSI